MRRWLVLALGVYGLCSLSLVAVSQRLESAAAEGGLLQSFDAGPLTRPVRRVVRDLDLGLAERAIAAGVRPVRLTWQGLWYFPSDATIDLHVRANGRAFVSVAGETIVHDGARQAAPVRRQLTLAAGYRALTVHYEHRGSASGLDVQWAAAGRRPGPIPAARLFVAVDVAAARRAAVVRTVARGVWLGVPIVLMGAWMAWRLVRAIGRAVRPPAVSGAEWLRPGVTAILASAAFVTAAVVRAWGIDFGLPHTWSRPDEEALIGMAQRFLLGSLDPEFYIYAPLFAYGLAILYGLYFLGGFITGAFALPVDAVANWHTDWVPFFLLSRWQSAAVGTATVLVVYRLALRVFDRETAVVAAFLLALAYLHARDSHFGTVDVTLACLVLLSTHFLLRAHLSSRWCAYVCAGVAGGLATATKYNAALVGVPFVVELVLGIAAGRGARGPLGPGRRFIGFALPFALVFLGLAPYTLIAFDQVLTTVRTVQDGLRTGAGFADLGHGWARHLTWTLRYGLGVPMLAASAVGVMAAARVEWRRTTILCAFPVAYYVVMGGYRWVFARYMVPVVPFVCLLAAVGIVWGARRLAALLPGVPRGLITIVATVVVLAPSAFRLVQFDRLLTRTDSRVVAAQWVHDHVPPGSSILQTGRFGRVQFDRTHVYDDWDARRLRDPGVRTTPDWIILQESPIGRYVEPSLRRLVGESYDLVTFVKGAGSADPANEFDLQDAFYVPFAGFRDVARPGPDIRIYRRQRH